MSASAVVPHAIIFMAFYSWLFG